MRVITTSGTTYETDGNTVTRIEPCMELRRDGEPIKILQFTTPVVGRRWDLLLMVREDGIATLRSTSPVVEVIP